MLLRGSGALLHAARPDAGDTAAHDPDSASAPRHSVRMGGNPRLGSEQLHPPSGEDGAVAQAR